MSAMKFSSEKSNASNDIINIDMNSNLRDLCLKIINDIQNKVFVDEDLSHERSMYILNNRNTIESELIHFLNDSIHQLNIDPQIRTRLITNLHQFSTNLTQIDNYSYINHSYGVNYDSDEESDVDDFTNDISSDQDYSCDDLENLILDEIELENDVHVLSHRAQDNQDNELILDSHNDDRSSGTCTIA